ncbi:hypothetical protein EVA_11208, partial [gut metagenome]
MEQKLAKQILRKEIAARKREHSAEQLTELSKKIMDRLEHTEEF